MNSFCTKPRALAVFAVTSALLISSCGGPSPIPPAEVCACGPGDLALRLRDGKKPAETTKADPPVQSVDSDWNNGRKLASYEILREEPSETDKRFIVKLKYLTPPAEAEAVYVVLATQPVAVFREADFERTLNMDNNPPVKKNKQKRR